MNVVRITCHLDHGPTLSMREETIFTKEEFIEELANCMERKKVMYGGEVIIDTSCIRYIIIDSFEAI